MSQPKKIFGTDGVRGTANVEPVTAETALQLGRAAAHVFKNLNRQARGRGKHKIVIGKDTRLSGYMLENAISSGILSMGVDRDPGIACRRLLDGIHDVRRLFGRRPIYRHNASDRLDNDRAIRLVVPRTLAGVQTRRGCRGLAGR